MFKRRIAALIVFTLAFIFIAPFLAMQNSTISAQSSASSDGWPMFRHDLQRTGYSTSNAPNTNSTSWVYSGTSEITSSPAVADGRLIVAQSNGDILALNIATGSVIWTCRTNAAAEFVWSSPAIDSGLVYVGMPDCNLYCLDAASGSVKWMYKTGGAIDSSPIVVNGEVFFTSEDGRLYCLDSTTGYPHWKTMLSSSGIFASPAFINSMFYVACNNGQVFSIKNVVNGSIMWGTGVRSLVSSSPCVGYNNVYFCSGGTAANGTDIPGTIACYNASYPRVWWSTTGNDNSLQIIHSSPALGDGKLFVGSNTGDMYSLDAFTGQVIWCVQTGRQIWGSPAVADGKVFFGCGGSGTIYCVSESTGTEVWSYATGSRVLSSPIVCGGVVYVCSGANIYAFGSPNPAPSATPSPTSQIPIATPNPTAFPTTLQAKTDEGATINLSISGNITTSQITNMTIASNDSTKTTTLSFQVAGESGTTGSSNITIPTSAVRYGTAPVIYIDDHQSENQGYTQDTDNYYVWYTTHFSSHQVSIVFTTPSSPPIPTVSHGPVEAQFNWIQIVYGVTGAVAIVIAVVVALKLVTRDKRRQKLLQK